MKIAASQRLADERQRPDTRRWAAKHVLRGIAVVLLGAVIVGFPAHSLPKPGFVRFGWQMFAMSRPAPEFTVTDRFGSESEVATFEIAAKLRPDVDYVVPGVEWICEHDAEAVHVSATIAGQDAGNFSCTDF